MNKRLKFLLYTLFFVAFNFQKIKGQSANNFEILEVKTDKTYFNLIENDNKLYIGTSLGTIIIDGKTLNETFDEKFKGYIGIEKGQLTGNSTSFGHLIKEDENIYNYLLPENYRNLISRHIKFNTKLYIVNSGKLFLFKENYYRISHDTLSVRSITNNYIGSYKGVFKNGVKIKFPEYTDGYIREFSNETFICYEGLYRDSNNIVTIYANSNKEVVFNEKNLGFARDIQEIGNGSYALTTTKGIYIVNFANKSITLIYEEPYLNENHFVFKIEPVDKNLARIFFTVKNKIFYYVVQSKETTLLYDTKYKMDIKQAFFPNTIDKIYLLFEDKLSLITLQNKNYKETILMDGLSFCHNLQFYKENLIISSNVGLHFFDLKKNKGYYNIIPVEINNRSLTILGDSIKFGTINGIINLSKENLEKIAEEYDNTSLTKNSQVKDTNTNYFIFFGIIFILTIAIIILMYYIIKNKKTENKEQEKEFYGEANKDNIIYYIQENITTVTIQSIKDQFNLTPIALYEILGNDKPGEIIRNYRMELVRKYRRMKVSEEEISSKTGFSISYLKKIY